MNNARRILVMEDDADISFMIRLMLERKGFSVVSVEAEEVIETVRNNNIDLVIMDMFLAGANGLEICTVLKADHETAHVPIIMMSGHPNAADDCKAAGADNFISKPFDMDDLLSCINHSHSSQIV